jgi:hypothetical protein
MKHILLMAVAFAVIAWMFMKYRDGFTNPSTKVDSPCPAGYKQCPSGDCALSTDVHGRCPS